MRNISTILFLCVLFFEPSLAQARPATPAQMTEHTTTYEVTVDYNMSLNDMIAAGKYEYVHQHITAQNFPHKKGKARKVKLHAIYFGRMLSTKQILAEFDKQNLRPATLPELLALGAIRPEPQPIFIVALGSIHRYLRGPYNAVTSIYGIDGEQRLLLNANSGTGRWSRSYRFLAVKVSSLVS